MVNSVPTAKTYPTRFNTREAKVIDTALNGTGSITNKTLGITNTFTMHDTITTIVDGAAVTKVLGFDVSGMTAAKTFTFTPVSNVNSIFKVNFTGSTTGKYLSLAAAVTDDRIITFPDATGTVDLIGSAQTISAIKTFTVRPSLDNNVGLQFKELDANGENFVFVKAPDDCLNADKTVILPNHTCTMPAADGTSGQMMQTNGSGVWSFATVAYKLKTFTVDHAAITLGTPLLVGTAIPAGSIVVAGGVQITEAFTGSIDGTATMKFGLEDADNDLMTAAAVVGAPWSATGMKTFTGTEGAALAINTPATGWYVQTVGKQLNVTTVANNDVTLTAGTAIVHILYI